MKYFTIIKEKSGRVVQKCFKCKYISPTVYNNPEKMSLGLKLHLIKAHKVKFEKNEN